MDSIVASLPLLYAVADHKVVLVPVKDAREHALLRQLVKGHFHSHIVQTDILRSLADAQHVDATAGYVAVLAEHLHGIALAVILGYHAQGCRAAVRGVELAVVGEFSQYFHLFLGFLFQW